MYVEINCSNCESYVFKYLWKKDVYDNTHIIKQCQGCNFVTHVPRSPETFMLVKLHGDKEFRSKKLLKLEKKENLNQISLF